MNQSYSGGGFAAPQPRAANTALATMDEMPNGLPTQTHHTRPAVTFSYAPPVLPATANLGSTEIRPTSQAGQQAGQQTLFPQPITLRLEPEIPQDAVEAPITPQEAFAGSMKALLGRNVGHYVVASFLIGTQNPVSWEGFLHAVGNDYLVIFQPDMGRYVTCDLYSLKFVEFHDQKGVVPPCAGYRRRDAAHYW